MVHCLWPKPNTRDFQGGDTLALTLSMPIFPILATYIAHVSIDFFEIEKSKPDRSKAARQAPRTTSRPMRAGCVKRMSKTGVQNHMGTDARWMHREKPQDAPRSISRPMQDGCRQSAIMQGSLVALVMFIGAIKSCLGPTLAQLLRSVGCLTFRRASQEA